VRKLFFMGTLLFPMFLLILFVLPATLASQDRFEARVDKSEITEEEVVSLEITLQLEGNLRGVPQPTYSAPDFEVFSRSSNSFLESYQDRGRLGMRVRLRFTHLLRPQKRGKLKIENISINVDGRTLRANDLEIEVKAGGRGTPPPTHYGGNLGLGGNAKPRGTSPFFLKADVDKTRVYQGEQVFIGYHLYRRNRIFDAEVLKYPILPGFFREELEMPIATSRELPFEAVVVDGEVLERALLLRYAGYPVTSGELFVDTMELRAKYYLQDQFEPGQRQGRGGSDPFSHFFQRMTPQTADDGSEPVRIEVLPLPADRPDSFLGGVGQFQLVSAMDRYEVPVGEVATLTVKVEGRGNAGVISSPDLKLPRGLRLFESKDQAKRSRSGMSEKVFQFSVMPEREGDYQIPAIEMAYFDPQIEEYVVERTEEVTLRALPAREGGVAQSFEQRFQDETLESGDSKVFAELREMDWSQSQWSRKTLWSAGYGVLFFGVLLMGLLALRERLLEKKEVQKAYLLSQEWTQFRKELFKSESIESSFLQKSSTRLEELFLHELSRFTGEPLKSRQRAEILSLLSKLDLNAMMLRRLEEALDEMDEMRYSKKSDQSSNDESSRRHMLLQRAEEAEAILTTVATLWRERHVKESKTKKT
jgi:hypothetical protein